MRVSGSPGREASPIDTLTDLITKLGLPIALLIVPAETIGDGLGYDVLSFDDGDDSEKLIEVKTTGRGKFFPFYVTVNEVRCSEDMTEQFHLFRVFSFAQDPRVYILTGSLREHCQLDAVLFRATI